MTAVQKLWDLVEDSKTCMMVAHTKDGDLHGRPMRAIPDRDAGEIWFYTRLSSGKSGDLESDGDVCLSFASPGSSDFVSISGTATLSTDREMIRKHWSRFVDAWFPEGAEGGDVGMIRVDAKRGEYWDGESSSVLAALKMVLASERDEEPDLGENRKTSAL